MCHSVVAYSTSTSRRFARASCSQLLVSQESISLIMDIPRNAPRWVLKLYPHETCMNGKVNPCANDMCANHTSRSLCRRANSSNLWREKGILLSFFHNRMYRKEGVSSLGIVSEWQSDKGAISNSCFIAWVSGQTSNI